MITLTILGVLIVAMVAVMLLFGGVFLAFFGDILIALLAIACIVRLCRWIGGRKNKEEKKD